MRKSPTHDPQCSNSIKWKEEVDGQPYQPYAMDPNEVVPNDVFEVTGSASLGKDQRLISASSFSWKGNWPRRSNMSVRGPKQRTTCRYMYHRMWLVSISQKWTAHNATSRFTPENCSCINSVCEGTYHFAAKCLSENKELISTLSCTYT